MECASSVTESASPGAPVKKIPGSYNLPIVGAILDRFEYFRGIDSFFQHRLEKYKSTVLRVNLPPGPPFFSQNRVITLLDGKSFPVLYDLSKVEKKSLNIGSNYMPNTDYSGGYRVNVFLDPSEEKHHTLKTWCLELLRRSGHKYFSEFARVFDDFGVVVEK